MGVVGVPRFSVWRVDLDPTRGSEQAGHRPVLVVSPDEMNANLNTVIVAPLTTRLRGWPTRVRVEHEKKVGEVALDQLRAIDRSRLGRGLGNLRAAHRTPVLNVLAAMFAP